MVVLLSIGFEIPWKRGSQCSKASCLRISWCNSQAIGGTPSVDILRTIVDAEAQNRESRTGIATPDRRELLNHTAANAGTSVARRIGLPVVCLLVDHNKGSNMFHDGQPSGTFGSGPDDELDCPVQRLTLLFFAAAKDVPEAAAMVTAGTACLHPDMRAKGQTGHCFSRRCGL